MSHGNDVLPKCFDMLRHTIRDLCANKIPLQDIGLTKTIKAKYKSENLPHVRVAQKMRDRGETVRSNDRVTFVVLQDKSGKKTPGKICDRVEDANYVEKHPQLLQQIDYNYYIDHQLYQPLEQLFGAIDDRQFHKVVEEEKRSASQKRGTNQKRSFVALFEAASKRQKQKEMEQV